jgi:hypothetical protein
MCGGSYVATSVTITERERTYLSEKTHRIHDQYSRRQLVRLLSLLKLVVCITGMNGVQPNEISVKPRPISMGEGQVRAYLMQCSGAEAVEQFERISVSLKPDRKIQSCSPSLTLNDEDCFVVNPVLFSNLPQMVVVFCRVLQQRIADVSC